MDSFGSNVLITLAVIGKIILWIVLRTKNILSLGIAWVVLICIASALVPMGGTICFIILKLIGALDLGWIWILLTIVLDGLSVSAFFQNA